MLLDINYVSIYNSVCIEIVHISHVHVQSVPMCEVVHTAGCLFVKRRVWGRQVDRSSVCQLSTFDSHNEATTPSQQPVQMQLKHTGDE